MISLDEARNAVLDAVGRIDVRRVPIRRASGLVLAEQVVAREQVPPFANSAMDGYAVRSVDTADASMSTPVRLRVVGELPAGRAPTVAVAAGEAIRIMTGAPVPDGNCLAPGTGVGTGVGAPFGGGWMAGAALGEGAGSGDGALFC